jgi:membrane-bound metal-dependent hydrolase YbcI (DUF457 family)
MPLPIAHGLLGASVVAALRPSSEPHRGKILLVGALLAISPDFDYVLNWLRIPYGGWHHGFTHSIPFALVMGLVMIAVFRDWKLRSYLVFTLTYVSHTLLDFMFTESRGVALWWPFTNHRYKLRLPYPIDYGWSHASLLATVFDVVKLCIAELLIFVPILFVVMWIRRHNSEHLTADFRG